MLVNSITLYSTPLDIEHSKIIDLYLIIQQSELNENTYNTYYDKALDNYEKMPINLETYKSLKISGKKCTLTLQENYFDILKYNYCKINDKYFFIESITSQNDSETNPSCTLSLIWDYWANNLKVIYGDEKSLQSSIINRRHINRFYNNDINKPLFYGNDINELKHTEYEIPYVRYLPLYLKLVLNPSIYVESAYGGKGFRFNNIFKCTFNGRSYNVKNRSVGIHTGDKTSSADIIYLPLGIYDTLNEKYVDGYIHINFSKTFSTGNTVNIDDYYETYFNETDSSFMLNSNFTKDILSAELSFYSPIEYSISTYDGKTSLEYNIPSLISDSLDGIVYNTTYDRGYKPDIPILATASGIVLVASETPSESVVIGFDDSDIPIKTINEYDLNYLENVQYELINDDVDAFDSMADPKFRQYPYNYLKLSYRDGDIILSPMGINNNNFKIEICNDTNQPHLKIKLIDYNGNENYLYKGKLYLNNGGYLAYTENALASFQARYGNQLSTDLTINGLIKPITQMLTKAPADILGGFMGMGSGLLRNTETFIDVGSTYAQYDAKIADLNNTPSKLINSLLSEYDITEQDRVRIYRCTVTDLQLLETHKTDFYLHGYEINSLGNPFTNYRFWFDYVRCNNCKLSFTMDSDDRREIENMFNRGVHKFHYVWDGVNQKEYFNRLLSLNRYGSNIERGLVKYN